MSNVWRLKFTQSKHSLTGHQYFTRPWFQPSLHSADSLTISVVSCCDFDTIFYWTWGIEVGVSNGFSFTFMGWLLIIIYDGRRVLESSESTVGQNRIIMETQSDTTIQCSSTMARTWTNHRGVLWSRDLLSTNQNAAQSCATLQWGHCSVTATQPGLHSCY